MQLLDAFQDIKGWKSTIPVNKGSGTPLPTFTCNSDQDNGKTTIVVMSRFE